MNTENVIDTPAIEVPPQTTDEKFAQISKTITSLVEEVNRIIDNINKKFTNIDIANAQTAFRFDTLLRFLLVTGKLTTDEMLNALDNQNTFITNLNRINVLPTVLERVNEALKYNTSNTFQIQADDLNLLALLKAAGGTKQSVVDTICVLPHSVRLANSLKEYV